MICTKRSGGNCLDKHHSVESIDVFHHPLSEAFVAHWVEVIAVVERAFVHNLSLFSFVVAEWSNTYTIRYLSATSERISLYCVMDAAECLFWSLYFSLGRES